MEIVGTFAGDGVQHVRLPFRSGTLCGLMVAMEPVYEDGVYVGDETPKPGSYAYPCNYCEEKVNKLEDFLFSG